MSFGFRFEPDIQFASAFHLPGPLDLGHGTCDIAARRYDDLAIHRNRKHRFEIDAITLRGVLGADAVNHAQRDLGARLNRVRLRRDVRGRGLGRSHRTHGKKRDCH